MLLCGFGSAIAVAIVALLGRVGLVSLRCLILVGWLHLFKILIKISKLNVVAIQFYTELISALSLVIGK